MDELFVEKQIIVNETRVFCGPIERFLRMNLSLSDSEAILYHTSTMAQYQEM